MKLERPVIATEGGSLLLRSDVAAGLFRASDRALGPRELERRLDALSLRHALLERILHSETRRPFQDGFLIQRLKRLRLRIKDEMAKLEAKVRTTRGPELARHAAR